MLVDDELDELIDELAPEAEPQAPTSSRFTPFSSSPLMTFIGTDPKPMSDEVIATAKNLYNKWANVVPSYDIKGRKLQACTELLGTEELAGDPVPDRIKVTPEYDAMRDTTAKEFIGELPDEQRDNFYWVKSKEDVDLVHEEQNAYLERASDTQRHGEIVSFWEPVNLVASLLEPASVAAMLMTGGIVTGVGSILGAARTCVAGLTKAVIEGASHAAVFGATHTLADEEIKTAKALEVGLKLEERDLAHDVMLNAMYGAGFGALVGGLAGGIRAARIKATEMRVMSKSELANRDETVGLQKKELVDPDNTVYSVDVSLDEAHAVLSNGETRKLPQRLSGTLAKMLTPVIQCLEEKLPEAAAFHLGTHQHNIIKYRLTGELPLAEMIEQDIGQYFQVARGHYEEACASFVKNKHGAIADFNDAYCRSMHTGIESGNPLVDKIVQQNRALMKEYTSIAAKEGIFENISYEHALVDVGNMTADDVFTAIMLHNDSNKADLARKYAIDVIRKRDSISSGAIIMEKSEGQIRAPGFFNKNLGEMTGKQMAAWSNSRIIEGDWHLKLSDTHGENVLHQAKDWITRGLKEFPTVKGSREYFPVRWDEQLILANEKEFKEQMVAALAKQDSAYQAANTAQGQQTALTRLNEQINVLLDDIYGRSMSGATQSFIQPGKLSAVKERVLNIDPTDVFKFLSKDTYQLQESYIRQMSFETRTRQFIRSQGWDKKYEVSTFDEYAEKVVASGAVDMYHKGLITRKETDGIIKRFNALREIYGGRRMPGAGNKRVDDILRNVSTMNYMSKCGMMAISLINDIAHSAFRNPFGLMRDINMWASECFGKLKGWGLSDNALRSQLVGIEGMRNNSRFMAALYQDGVSSKIGKLAARFGKVTGIEFAERMRAFAIQRRIAFEITQDAVGKTPMAYKNKMHNVQVDSAMKKRWAEQIEKHGDISHENFDVGVERWTDIKAQRLFNSECKRLASLELIKPGPMQMPEIFRTGPGRFFYAFYSYISGLSSNLLGPLLANKNYGELANIMVHGYALGLLTTKLRSLLRNQDLDWNDPHLYERAVHEMPTGLAGYVINPLMSGICNAANGELRIASSKDIMYSILHNGPGGWVADTIDATHSALDIGSKVIGLNEKPVYKSDVKRMLKMVPGNNLIWFAPILNYGLMPQLQLSPREKAFETKRDIKRKLASK